MIDLEEITNFATQANQPLLMLKNATNYPKHVSFEWALQS